MKDLLLLLTHLLTTIAKLRGPGGARAVVADSLLMKQQLLIINRPAACAQSFGTGSIPVGFLVTVSQPTPSPAGCCRYPAIDTAEIPHPTQTAQVSTTVFINWQQTKTRPQRPIPRTHPGNH